MEMYAGQQDAGGRRLHGAPTPPQASVQILCSLRPGRTGSQSLTLSRTSLFAKHAGGRLPGGAGGQRQTRGGTEPAPQ